MNSIVDFIKMFQAFGLEWFRRYYSIYRAEVADNNDPQGRGRIQVIVPFLSSAPLDHWAVPVSPYAGKGYGTFFPPEKGDFVWVCFENGNPAYPVYIGGWWAEGETPDGFAITRRGIRTKNCEIYFDDKDKVINVKTPAATLTLDDTNRKVTIEIGGESIALDSGANQVSVKADTKVSVEAPQVLVTGNVGLDGNVFCGGGIGSGQKVLLDGETHICVITGAPVATPAVKAQKTRAS